MDPDQGDLQPERELTDESLRNERAKTDEELGARLRIIEEDAVAVVENARANADAVVGAARDLADQKPHNAGRRRPADDAILEARALEDEVLARERAATDEKLRSKQADVSMLLRLLPIEREKTDQYLLTERERADEAISNRDDFLSIVSHDLRNLLGIVSLGAQFIERHDLHDGSRDSTVAAAQRILRASARMTRLIGDLVDISSIEAGKLAITTLPDDATALVADAVAMFRPAAIDKGISLESEGGMPLLMGIFDRGRVLQVLANLIGNAIKFTPRGGEIRIGGERADGEIRLSVRDTGPGIPESQREAVFERFWQVGANDRRGLGLGLYIAKSIIEAQGGKIWAESKVGEGSTFHFTLPAADRASISQAPGPQPSPRP